MGWDAYAEPVERLWEWRDGRNGLRDPRMDQVFAAAAERVTAATGTCDWMLPQAGLDVSLCADELSRATGEDVYPDGPHIQGKFDWTPGTVRRLAAEARWVEPEDSKLLWAFHSAREFLNTCAELGLGVRFSW